MKLSELLRDLLPAKVRLWIYLVLAVAALVFTVWQATEGDVVEFIGGLVTALSGALAAGNTTLPVEAAPNEQNEIVGH